MKATDSKPSKVATYVCRTIAIILGMVVAEYSLLAMTNSLGDKHYYIALGGIMGIVVLFLIWYIFKLPEEIKKTNEYIRREKLGILSEEDEDELL